MGFEDAGAELSGEAPNLRAPRPGGRGGGWLVQGSDLSASSSRLVGKRGSSHFTDGKSEGVRRATPSVSYRDLNVIIIVIWDLSQVFPRGSKSLPLSCSLRAGAHTLLCFSAPSQLGPGQSRSGPKASAWSSCLSTYFSTSRVSTRATKLLGT